MDIEHRRGRFRVDKDVAFSNDPVVDIFFRQVRVYRADTKGEIIHYRGVSTLFDVVDPGTAEPSYDLYVQNGSLHAERIDFEEEHDGLS